MKKIKFELSPVLRVKGRITCFDLSEMELFRRDVISMLKNIKNKVDVQRIESLARQHNLANLESFICLNDAFFENGIQGYTLDGMATDVSTVISMLIKKNKSELDYRDLIANKNILIEKLNSSYKETTINLESLECVIDFEHNILVSQAGLAIYSKLDLPVHGICLKGKVKTYLKEFRDMFGNITTDVYKNNLGAIVDEQLSLSNYSMVRPYLRSRFVDMIDKYGLISLSENEFAAHELKEILLAYYGSESYSTLNGHSVTWLPVRFELCEE